MNKTQLLRLVEGLPDDASIEQLQEVEDLLDEAVQMQLLLLMRAAFRLRDMEARRDKGGVMVDPDEEALT